MQRASSLTSLKSKSTSSPKSAAHPSPRTEDQEPHAAKRVKTSHSANYLPITPNNASTPVSATYSARRPTGLRAEDGERDAAFEGSGGAERGGETKWFFSFRAEDDTGVCGNVTNGGLKVEIMGTRPSMEEDSDVEGDETPPWSGDEGLGRRLFGVDKKGWARSRARSDGRVSEVFNMNVEILACGIYSVAYSTFVLLSKAILPFYTYGKAMCISIHISQLYTC